MSKSPSLRPINWLVVLLLSAVALSGCLGDDDPGTNTATDQDPEDPDADLRPPARDPDEILDPDDLNETEKEQEQVPEAHFHHYWGNPPLEWMTIFLGEVQLDFDACFDSDTEQEPPCMGPEPHMGSVTFDLEDDGDQVGVDARDPHVNQHADTVFTGTSHIIADFTWDDQLLGNSLLFSYKAANSPIFQPAEGIVLTTDDASVTIPVKAGMADPAHQFKVSRWEFMLVANAGPTEDWAFPMYIANGTVSVDMRAYNGGKSSIDPPHPDPWKGNTALKLGGAEGDFSVQSVAVEDDTAGINQDVIQGDGFDGIQMPVKAIVPTGTEKLVVKAWVNATDQVSPNLDWGLKWHGADSTVYQIAEDFSGEGAERVFEIYVPDEAVDPPYEKISFFRFGFFPILNGEAGTGTYEADFSLKFEVHKKPGFTYYF